MATYTIDGLSVSCYGAGNGTVLDTISLIYPPAGSQDQVWVEILDKNLVSQGVIQFATLTATLYYNQVGSWSMRRESRTPARLSALEISRGKSMVTCLRLRTVRLR